MLPQRLERATLPRAKHLRSAEAVQKRRGGVRSWLRYRMFCRRHDEKRRRSGTKPEPTGKGSPGQKPGAQKSRPAFAAGLWEKMPAPSEKMPGWDEYGSTLLDQGDTREGAGARQGLAG